MLNLSKATFHRANRFQISMVRFYHFFTGHDQDKSTVEKKEKGSMKVEQRVKGKVACKTERIRFTARQKVV